MIWLALGLASKPMLVTLPFVLLLLDYWPLERFSRAARVAPRGRCRARIGLARAREESDCEEDDYRAGEAQVDSVPDHRERGAEDERHRHRVGDVEVAYDLLALQ